MFSRHLFPNEPERYDLDMEFSRIGSLMPYHSHVEPTVVLNAVNHMIDTVNAGQTIFYDFYSEKQKQQDASRANTGLFFFKGRPGAPFAVICPGGGFMYVGSLHEGFPYAREISKKGYNAFVLRYRTGGLLPAVQDLTAALEFILKNASLLEVSVNDYSLWGSSAGARMVASVGSSDMETSGPRVFPPPVILVMAYTGHTGFGRNDPPTFVTISTDDPIVNLATVENRVSKMRHAGIDVEYDRYTHAGHGFGLGVGTDAFGWTEHAIRFWEKHMPKTYHEIKIQ